MSGKQLRVLLVNDSTNNGHESLEKVLFREKRLEITIANDVADCLRHVRESDGNFDAVVFDAAHQQKPRSLKPIKLIKANYPHIELVTTNINQPGNGHKLKKETDSSRLSSFLRKDGLGAYIAAITEASRLKAELRQRELEHDWFRGLLSISQSITASRTPQGVAEEIYKQLCPLIPTMNSFYIAIHDKKRNELRFILMVDKGQRIRKFTRRLSGKEEWGLARHIINKRKPIFIEDVLARGNQWPVRSFHGGKHTRTYFGLPLVSGENLLGIISIQSYTPDAFNADHRRLIQTIANQTAVAIENALLHEQEASQLMLVPSKLYETISAIRTVVNLKDVLNLIVVNLQELFDLDTCTIGLIDANKTKVKIVAERGVGKKVTRYLKDLPKGLVRKVLTSSEPIEIQNVERSPVFRKALVRPDLKSYVILPLLGQHDLHGVINMGSTKQISLPPAQKKLLKALADQAAIAIENARLHKQTQSWAQQLENMSRMTLDIANQEDQDDKLLRAISRMAATLLKSPGGGVYLYTKTGDALVLEAIEGLPLRLERKHIKLGRGLIGRVLKTCKPLAIRNYRKWPQRLRILDEFKIEAAVGAPIMSGDEVLGAVVVHDKEEGRVYTPADEKLLQHFAGHAGVAIQKARKAIQERAELLEEEKVISRVTHALTVELDYRKLLNRVTEVLREHLGYQSSGLFLNDTLADTLKIASKTDDSASISRIKFEQGVVGHVAGTGKPYIVADVTKEPLYLPGLGRGSEIAVPLKVPTSNGTKLIGALDVESSEINAFGERDKRILTKVAATLALALETAQKTARLQALADLGMTIAGSKNLDEILEKVAREILSACPATFCHIMLRTRDAQNILRVREWQEAPRANSLDWKPQRGETCHLLTDPGLAKMVRRASSIVFRRKKNLGYKFVNGFARHVLLRGKLDSALLIPLRGVGGRVIGTCVLGEMRKWERSPFNKENIEFATALAAQAAIAVEKGRGHELASERTKTMDRLHQVGNSIAATLELDEVLKQIVDAARELLRAEVGSIFLMRRQGYLSLETASGSPPRDSQKPLELLVTKNRGLTGHIAKLGRLFSKHGSDLTNHPAVLRKGPQSHLPSRYCHSLLAIPLKSRKGRRTELVGLIKVENKLDQTGKVAPQRGFDKTDIVVLKTLASYAETALQNVRLYELAKSSQSVAEAVNSTLDFEEVLQLILAQLKGLLPFDTTSLQLLRGGQLKIVACEGFGAADKKKVLKLSFPASDRKFPNYKVIQSKRPYSIQDIRATKYKHFWDEAHVYCSGNIRSWIGIPLLRGREIIGMLSVESKKPFCYTNQHKELSVAFARQVASAVVNAKLYKTSRSLLNIILDITEQLDLNLVLNKLARDVIDKEGMIAADNVVIYMYDPDLDQVELKPVCKGLPASTRRGLNIQYRPQSAVYQLLHSPQPHIQNNVRTDPLLYRGFARRVGVRSAGVFPLMVGDRSVGVMYVNYLSPHVFEDTEIELISLIAQKAALAIQHARKYEAVSERFEIVMNAAMNHFAMSAYAHAARKINFDLAVTLRLLKSSLGKVSRQSDKYIKELTQFSVSLAEIQPPLVDLAQGREVDMDRVFEEVRQKLMPEIEKKHIDVDYNLQVLPPVRANQWLLAETFQHLTQNAIKALPEGGTIRVSGHVKEGNVYITFNDDGPGLPPRVLRFLFKKKVPSKGPRDSGVGLLLSKMYLNFCGGDLTLHQTSAKGTSFVLKLSAAN